MPFHVFCREASFQEFRSMDRPRLLGNVQRLLLMGFVCIETIVVVLSRIIRGQRSGRITRRHTRRPGPIEIMPAKMTGDVDDFADKEQVGFVVYCHGF